MRLPSNCQIWCIWKFIRHGGDLHRERSRFGWWNHYAWRPPGGTWRTYEPIKRKLKRPWWNPPVLFFGHVKEGKR